MVLKLDNVTTECEFLIADILDDGILGIPFLTQTKSKLDFSTKSFEVGGTKLNVVDRSGSFVSQGVRCNRTMTIPARCQYVLPGRIKRPNKETQVLIEPSRKFVSKKCLLVAKVLCKPDSCLVPVRVCNPLNEPVTVYRGTILGRLAALKH